MSDNPDDEGISRPATPQEIEDLNIFRDYLIKKSRLVEEVTGEPEPKVDLQLTFEEFTGLFGLLAELDRNNHRGPEARHLMKVLGEQASSQWGKF